MATKELVSNRGSHWAGSSIAAAATIVLHALLLSQFVAGSVTGKRRLPDAPGTGAVSMNRDADGVEAMILLDLTGISVSTESLPEEIQSAGSLETSLPIVLASPDPLPAFERADLSPGVIDAAQAEPPAETLGRSQLFGQYVGLVSARIERAWRKPGSPNALGDFECTVRIEQDREGNVRSIELMRCNEDTPWQLSLVRAIESASPLSAPPDPSVFAGQLVLSFSSYNANDSGG